MQPMGIDWSEQTGSGKDSGVNEHGLVTSGHWST